MEDDKKRKVVIIREGFRLSRVLLAFVTGATAGVVTALLAAPRSGADTRARIRDRLKSIPDALQAAKSAAQDAFHNALEGSAPVARR